MIKFYYGSGSPFAWRVWLALEYKSLPYELISMSFSDGGLKTPGYLEVNPRGKVPSIVDGSFSLYESAAIVEYLDETYRGNGQVLFPGDSSNKARIRRLINEADLYLDQANRKILFPVLFTQKEEWDEKQILNGREAVAAELGRFESMLAGEFFAGKLSAADFAIYPMLALTLRVQLRKPDLDMTSLVGPKMTEWMRRVESLTIFSKTYPPHWKSQ